MIDFVKAHGTGNDFVVIEDLADRLDISPEAVKALCDRHFGIGADGVIRITRGEVAPFFMDYRNADGSLAEMCGNGVRVVGKYLGDRGHATETVDLETRAGVKVLSLLRDELGHVANVTVDMGPPVGAVTHQDEWTLVSMGNPHAVVLCNNIDTVPVGTVGSEMEHATPGGINTEYVDRRDDGILRQRTWERGVGETLACGTGACAVAVAAITNGWAQSPVHIELRGGPLHIEWDGAGGVMMTGDAIEVFSAQLDPQRFGIRQK